MKWNKMDSIPTYNTEILICFENGSVRQTLYWSITWEQILSLGTKYTGDPIAWIYWDDIKPDLLGSE